MDTINSIVVNLDGPVSITDSQGNPVDVNGSKPLGLLILLACSKEMRCNRKWVQDKLWSTREPEQASGSLRQALATLKKALALEPGIVSGNRSYIWLNSELVTLRCSDCSNSDEAEDIAAGFTAKDPEFSKWLQQYRSSKVTSKSNTQPNQTYQAPQAIRNEKITNNGPILYLSPTIGSTPLNKMVGDLINQQVAQNISENLGLEIRIPTKIGSILASEARTIELTSIVEESNNTILATIRLTQPNDGRLIYQKSLTLPANVNHILSEERIHQIAHETTECALGYLCNPDNQQSENHYYHSLYLRALRELFSFDHSRLRVAEELFGYIYTCNHEPAILAWRAFTNMLMFIERVDPSDVTFVANAKSQLREAIEVGPGNATVLALNSLFELYINDNADFSLVLSADALKRNPGNAMAHTAYASTQLRLGNIESAVAHSQSGLEIVSSSQNKHWWHLMSCLANLSAGNLNKAIKQAEFATAYAPHFRPPLRHLYAMYLKQGDIQRAKQTLTRLQSIEPEFSLEMIRSTADYPAALLRSTGLIDQQDIATKLH